MLLAPAAVQPGGKHRDDFQHALGQPLLEAGPSALADDDDFDALQFAQRERRFRAKPQEPVPVRDGQPLHAPVRDHFDQPGRPGLVAVHPGTQVLDDLAAPALGRAAGFKHFLLAGQIRFPVAPGRPRIRIDYKTLLFTPA